MFIVLRNRFFKPQRLLAPNLLILQTKTLIYQFSSLHSSSDSSESTPISTPEQITGLFRHHGFTETQISRLVKMRPTILKANPEKSIAPKLEFLLSIGIPKTRLPKFVCSNIRLLETSLQNQLIPCHSYFKSLLLTDENVVKMLLQTSRILQYNVDKTIAPNINLLTQTGFPKSKILRLLSRFSCVVCERHSELKMIVEEVIRLGFDPTKEAFAQVLNVFCGLKTITLDRKWKLYKSWGLSDNEVAIMFHLDPRSFSLSEEKITKAMDIFVNEMGRKALEVAKAPYILLFNVENRIKPRCKVIKVLISKGLLKKTIAFGSFLKLTEAKFLEKFVSKYEDIVPVLLNIYQERQSI